MKRAILILSVTVGVLSALVLTALFAYFGATMGVRLDPNKLLLDRAAIRLYDSEGEKIETAARSSVPADGLHDYTLNAFVAVEDKRFYSHHGFDFRRMMKAAVKNIASFSFREGASTISQQLVKNTHLTSEKTLTRKMREFKLTRILEKNYSKREILELYLNSIYFGHDAFGIGSASAFYFGKDAEDLTPAESAMLAALVRSPNRYSPFRDAKTCLSRRNFVLSLMREQGYIDDREYAEGKEEPLPVAPNVKRSADTYLSAVFEELSELFPDARAGELGSLEVHTFLDKNLQAALERTETADDVCLLVQNNDSGGLRAIYSTCGLPKRSPASALKPLLVYGPALEEDIISPATPLLDERTDFGGYRPDDAGGASGNYMSARYALAHSVNIPAVKILNTLGCEKAVSYLKRMGMDVEAEDRTLALALGGMREGFTLRQLADGYSALARGGNFSPAKTIKRVVGADGKVLYEYRPKEERVFSEETNYLLCDMLKTAAREGTAKRLAALPFPVCAKTGTAEAGGKNTDAYTIAFTAEDTVAAWIGKKDRSPIEGTGGGLPANFVLSVMNTIYADRAPREIPACDKVKRAEYDLEAYETEHRILLADPCSPAVCRGSELFKTSALPKEVCTRYTSPSIQNPSIYVKNGAVYIELCQTKYYEYTVKRKNRGKSATIYSGKFQKIICDNSVRAGESYVYTVTPLYGGHEGTSVQLPEIVISSPAELPDDWWL